MNPFKSHLFWFILAGAAIFAVDSLRSRTETIVVDDSVAHRLTSLWVGQMGREPNGDELTNLLQSWLGEEIMYREALKLELDADDVIIRRRLVQKMDFIAEQAVADEPDDEALRSYFEANADTYMLPARFTFSQLMFRQQDAALTALDKLQEGADPAGLGEPGMLSPTWVIQSPREIATAFGGKFALQLGMLAAGPDWQGPIQSEFGSHLVLLRARYEPGMPGFDDVRNRVLTDYLYEARTRARETYLARIREHYNIQWQLTEQ